MDTSRPPLWQMTGCSRLSVLLILFAIGTRGEESSPITANKTDSPGKMIASPSNTEKTTKHTESDVSHPTSRSIETSSSSTLSLEKPSTAKPLTEEQQEQTTPKQTEVPQSTKDTKDPVRSEITPTAAILTPETQATTVVPKPHVTDGKPTSSGRPTTTVRSTGPMPRSSKGGKEMNATKGPPEHEAPTKHVSSRPKEIQTTTVASNASEADTGVKESPSKDSRGVTVMPASTPEPDTETTTSPSKVPRDVTVMSIPTTPGPNASHTKLSRGAIVAIVLCVLLLLVLLLVLLYCRRRHHSGSTTFKSAAWAGQAILPDDSGMDKELEQGALGMREGETRRATLTTFFGKRQSRVPSVAMEEVVQKETVNVEETQRLMDGDAGGVSGPEGSREANGKVRESTMQCSQDTEFPPPPATQEDTPPAKQE